MASERLTVLERVKRFVTWAKSDEGKDKVDTVRGTKEGGNAYIVPEDYKDTKLRGQIVVTTSTGKYYFASYKGGAKNNLTTESDQILDLGCFEITEKNPNTGKNINTVASILGKEKKALVSIRLSSGAKTSGEVDEEFTNAANKVLGLLEEQAAKAQEQAKIAKEERIAKNLEKAEMKDALSKVVSAVAEIAKKKEIEEEEALRKQREIDFSANALKFLDEHEKLEYISSDELAKELEIDELAKELEISEIKAVIDELISVGILEPTAVKGKNTNKINREVLNEYLGEDMSNAEPEVNDLTADKVEDESTGKGEEEASRNAEQNLNKSTKKMFARLVETTKQMLSKKEKAPKTYAPGERRGVAKHPIPKMVTLEGNDNFAGYIEFENVPVSAREDLKTPRKFRGTARVEQKHLKKMDEYNKGVKDNLQQLLNERSEIARQLVGAKGENRKALETRLKDVGNKINETFRSELKKQTVRLYISKNPGKNGKTDFYVEVGEKLPTGNELKNIKPENLQKLRDFARLSGQRKPSVAHTYSNYSKFSAEQKEYDIPATSHDIVVFGKNKELQNFLNAMQAVDKQKGNKTAYHDYLGDVLGNDISEELDKQRNSENRTAILKKGSGILKISKLAVTVGILSVAVGLAAGSQIAGATADAVNQGIVSDRVSAGATQYVQTMQKNEYAPTNSGNNNGGNDAVALSDETITSFRGTATLFNYKRVNTPDNVVIDTSSNSLISKLFNSNNAQTFGYDAKAVTNELMSNFGNQIAYANLFNGLPADYSPQEFESAYGVLGKVVGTEVKTMGTKSINGTPITYGVVVYPNGTTDDTSFTKFLQSKGVSTENAAAAVAAYDLAYQEAYAAAENQNIIVEEPVVEYDITKNDITADVNEALAEIGAQTEIETILNISYKENEENAMEGELFGLDSEGNLVQVSFKNGADFQIEVTDANGIVSALNNAIENSNVQTNVYRSIDSINGLSVSWKQNAEKYIGEKFGEASTGLYYNFEAKQDADGKGYYDVKVASVGGDTLSVTTAELNVYTYDKLSVTVGDIVKSALSGVNRKIAGSSTCYTLTKDTSSLKPVLYANELNEASINEIKAELSGNTNTSSVLYSTDKYNVVLDGRHNPERNR